MKSKQQIWRNITRIHKWAGAIIGIQIVIWFASGFFMTYFKIETVRGEHLTQKAGFELGAVDTISAAQAIQVYGNPVHSVKLISAVGVPLWQLDGDSGRLFVDAQSGERWKGLSQDKIREAAGQYYIGSGEIEAASLLDTPLSEYRGGALPVWQLKYNDKEKTRLYMSPYSGELLKTRTRLWRVFDFMWMLHIMGYSDRDNTNSWWVVLAAFCAFLFSLSGMALVVHRLFLKPQAKPRT